MVEIRAETANADILPFATAAGDLHSGYPLERLGQVLLGELADVLSGNGVDDCWRSTLLLNGGGEAGAETGDNDVLTVDRRLA